MTASVASMTDYTDMIINAVSLDYEKALKARLQSRQLAYILRILTENNIITLSQLFSLTDKDRIQRIVEQIDHTKHIDVYITTHDKWEFTNIVMDIIQSKVQRQTDAINFYENGGFINKMDQLQPAFNYNSHSSQTPPSNRPPPPNFQATNTATSAPLDLNFGLDDFEVAINIDDLGSVPLSQIPSAGNTPNYTAPNAYIPQFHSQILDGVHSQTPSQSNQSQPIQPTQPTTLANTFANKMKEAIEKNSNMSHTPPSQVNSNPNTHIIRKLTTKNTAIHPAQKGAQMTQIKTQFADYYVHSDDENDGAPNIGGVTAPQIDLTDMPTEDSETAEFNGVMTNGNHHSNNVHYNGHNGHVSANGHGQSQFMAPTPRGWKFQWDGSPRMNQASHTPARSPPQITDPMLIQNALQGVAYYADKLDSLHGEYRRVYGEQQQLNNSLQALQAHSQSMDPSAYSHSYNSIQNSYYSMSQTLQGLIIGIYEQFAKMKRSLDTKYDFQLDHNMRGQFDKFQRYYDQFANTQQHLLTFGHQQCIAKEKQEQAQAMKAQAQAQQYQVPPTPHNYRNRVSYENDYKQSNMYMQQINQRYQNMNNNMTPRGAQGSNSYNYNNMYANHNMRGQNVPKTTTALPKSFTWGRSPQQMAPKSNKVPRQAVTPRPSNHSNAKKSTSDIPNMGYVYIGSRMSQLISHIALSDGEISSHSTRISIALSDVLKSDASFSGFDIVPYGSSEHKLFIKDYSDFDFCIRCKNLGVSHDEGIDIIATALRETLKSEFETITIIDSIQQSIHGHYLKNISHISFFDKPSQCTVDVILNNLPEIGSSRFIAAYDSIDPRFALLCRVVKYWSRQRKINDPIHGTLSTYALVLMVINFLQLRRVLPTLSIMIFDRESGLSPWSTQDDFQINVQKYRDFASKNEEPHSKLLVGFFNFYSHKFDFAKDVVSVRTGTYLMKREKKWDKDSNAHFCCVENPFNSKTNLAVNVDKNSLKRIESEFHRAYAILCESYKIYEVCKLAEK